MAYKAFISYSHAADGRLAPMLQSALHRFAKPFYRLRALRVFRDKTSLHLSPELWPLIQQALADSEYFILLASPDAARSPWVQAEVDEWLSLKGGSLDKFLVVLTDGDIMWDGAADDFDWQATTALPPNLRGKFKREPLYSDLRWASKQTDLSLRHPQFLEEIGSVAATLHGRPKDEMIGQDVRQHRLFKLAAAAAGLLLLALTIGASGAAYYANEQRKLAVSQTELAQQQKAEADRQRQAAVEAAERERQAAQSEREARDREEQQRLKAERSAEQERLAKENETKQRRKAEQATENEKLARIQAEERRKEAERQSRIALSREVASSAKSQLNVDTELGALLAAEAVKVSRTEQAEEALRLAAFDSRLKAVLRVKEEPAEKDRRGIPMGFARTWEVYDAAFSPDGRYVATASAEAAHIWDAQTGQRVAELPTVEPSSIHHVEFSPDGRLLLTAGTRRATLWDARTGKNVREVWHQEDTGFGTDNRMNASLSSDGRLVLTIGRDSNARVWDASTGQRVALMEGHEGGIAAAAFSHDGGRVVTAGWDDTARVWEARTGKAVSVLNGHQDPVRSAAFSPDGKLVVTTSQDRTARVWDADTGKEVTSLRGHAGIVLTATFDPLGDYILTSGDDGTARVWEARTGKVVAELRGHTAALTVAAFSPDGKLIVTASTDGTARAWEAGFPAKGEEEKSIDIDPFFYQLRQIRWQGIGVLRGHRGSVMGAAFSPDGRSIVTAGADGTARVWEARFPQNLERLHGRASNLYAAFFSPDGKYLATCDRNDKIKVWDLQTGHSVELMSDVDDDTRTVVRFSPDSRFLLTKTFTDSYVWEVGTWKKLAGPLSPHIGEFSRDGKYALAEGGVVLATDIWQSVLELPGEKGAEFGPDGRFLVTNVEGGRTRVRRVGKWEVVAELPAAGAGFSPDGKLFLTGGPQGRESAVQVWDTEGEWKQLVELPEGVRAWSEDGRFVASMKDGPTRVREARTGRLLAELNGPARDKTGEVVNINGVVFSPDGRLLVSLSHDGKARLWETETGKELSVLRGHEGQVQAAAFSPDGRHVVTAGKDNTVRVWETATGLALATYRAQDDTDAVAFNRDGRYIITGEPEVFACDACYTLENLLDIARAHVTRELTPAEREKYLHQKQ